MDKKAVLFILLGQSNAVGHGIPMKDEDKITIPMKNVFGLSRKKNQSFDNTELFWDGYESAGMNLAEEQDHTYSVANQLARVWEDDLPDLYIVQIAIGAEGITDGYMWNPGYEKKLIPGKLGEVKISLYSYTCHILSLIKDSLKKSGKEDIKTVIHWRGGENDTTVKKEELEGCLKGIYEEIFNGFYDALGEKTEIFLHKILCANCFDEVDPSGEQTRSMHFINSVFEELEKENDNISIFDASKAPMYDDSRCNGIFELDAVHYTPEANLWVAKEIMEDLR